MADRQKLTWYCIMAAALLPLPALQMAATPVAAQTGVIGPIPASQGRGGATAEHTGTDSPAATKSATAASHQTLQDQLAQMAREIAHLKAHDRARTAKLQNEISQLKDRNTQTAAAQAAATRAATQASTRAVDHLYKKVMANSQAIARYNMDNHVNKISDAIASAFAPPTGKNYFSPFSIENPDHMRPDMHMQVARWDDMRFFIGLQTVGRFQALTQSNASFSGLAGANPDQNTLGDPVGAYPGLDPGFQTPFGNLEFMATIPHKLDIYFDLYLASRPDEDKVYGDQGYMVFKQLPGPFSKGPLGDLFKYINVKAGAFDVDFGDQNYHRTNNGFAQRNPLIGNYLVDPNTEEIGAEVYSIQGPIYWLTGLTTGTTRGHFTLPSTYGSRPAVHGKIWMYPMKDLRWSFSAYYSDLDGYSTAHNLLPGAGEGHNQLFALIRSGGVYAGVFGGGWDGDPGQITPLNGYDVQAYQTDLTWNHWPWEVYSFLGWTQDATYDERWLYGSAEATYHLNPALYLAGRFSYAVAGAVNGVDTNGWVDRFQIGGGYWLTRSMLAKVEYVYEQYNGFGAAEGDVDAVDAAQNPSFNGVIMEVSFGF